VGGTTDLRGFFAKQTFIGCPTNVCLDSFVFAEFFRKTGKATFAKSAYAGFPGQLADGKSMRKHKAKRGIRPQANINLLSASRALVHAGQAAWVGPRRDHLDRQGLPVHQGLPVRQGHHVRDHGAASS